MLGFQALAALFALVMLARHLPRALLFVSLFVSPAAKRRGDGEAPRLGSVLDVLSTVLALAILAVAVKALAVGLIS
jgi:hypothetical protein